MVSQHIPAEAQTYAKLVKEAKADASGVLLEEADKVRDMLVKTLYNKLKTQAQKRMLDYEEHIVSVLEQSKADRMEIEQSDRMTALNSKKKALLGTQDGADDEQEAEQEQDEQEYGAGQGNGDADEQYENGIE